MNAVEAHYVDALGNERDVPSTTREAFDAILAVHTGRPRILAFATVLRIDAPPAFVTTLPASSWAGRVSWTILCEDGAVHRGVAELRDAPVQGTTVFENETFDLRSIALPELPLGYHHASIDAGTYGPVDGALIIVPHAAVAPPHERAWGIAVQLYTLRSNHNWGIGDLGDLRRFIPLAARAGASYVGLNPLHAPNRSTPGAASPYSPASRRFLNWLAIDVGALPEAQDPQIAATIAGEEFQAQLEQLRADPFVDYNGVAECKDAILRRCFEHFRRTTPDDPEFAAFVAAGGVALARFAIFETLGERLGRHTHTWPQPYRDPTSADVHAFADAEAPAVQYSLYLQWRVAQQLAHAAAEGAAHGVSLYRDLAVGVDANGADVWVDSTAYVASASVGAPPDLLSPLGQDWGLPPLDPTELARDGYRTIAQLFRSNMAYAGALRIDHAMSLTRLFWIPRGESADAGGYVRYPFEDVLGILALESTRAQCVVIGEDLGTVPLGFRERMADARVLSYRILSFEREADLAFIPAERYPALALAAVGTHDLAPFLAWLDGSDITLREKLGLIDEPLAGAERTERDIDARRLVATLIQSGDLDPEDPDTSAVMIAAHRFLARSPAAIVMVQIDDALGELTPVNVPGTSDQYPNWRRKLPMDIDTIEANPQFARLATVLHTERPVYSEKNVV